MTKKKGRFTVEEIETRAEFIRELSTQLGWFLADQPITRQPTAAYAQTITAALLPLIEKAVREARIDEAGRIQCVCHKRTSLCDRCERIRIMEAGND